MLLRSFFLILSFFPHFTNAQTLTGSIFDLETGEPIDAATIFFTNTTYGTLSNPDGSFTIPAPLGKSELVITHISFRMKKYPVVFTKEETKKRTIRLTAESKELQTITVYSKRDKRWRKDLKKFKKMFLGQTKNAAQSEILNPTVLQFEKSGPLFTATANDILQIKNQALGYKIYFLLEHFEAKGQGVTYAGKTYFEELTPSGKKQKKVWIKKRKTAYNGSLTHFLHALLNNRLAIEGFKINEAKLENNNYFLVGKNLRAKDLVIPASIKSNPSVSFDGFLQVVFNGEKDISNTAQSTFGKSASGLGQAAEKDMIDQEASSMNNNLKDQVSYLFARKNNISFDTSGYLDRPELLVAFGYWNNEGVADLVPRNFDNNRIFPEKETKPKHDPILGFEMTNLRIPYKEIKKGGPPKDGIPSINHPKFVRPEQASNFLNEKDYVLGIEVNGVAKAYPIRILNYHEIVNDSIGDKPIVITYCPLCASGAAFSAKVDNQKFTFGVSGLLYNSDVLLYDHQTESLWSQILSEAVSGSSSSKSLTLLPTTYTTFENWKMLHPKSLILSTETGAKRDYTTTPYVGYENSNKLFFPVSSESNVLKRKDKILGVEIDGKFKAYPFKNIKKLEGVIKDSFNGKDLIIRYNPSAKSATISDLDGNHLPSITLYWFAWYAFHPETEIYK